MELSFGTYTKHKYCKRTTVELRKDSISRGVAGTREDRQAGVFGKGGIGLGELAEEELGAFGGFDMASVEAVCAET